MAKWDRGLSSLFGIGRWNKGPTMKSKISTIALPLKNKQTVFFLND